MLLNPVLNINDPPEAVTKGLLRGTLQVKTLPVNQMLFRFASSQIPYQYREAGPWWVDQENYLKIIAACKSSFQQYGARRLKLGSLGRSALAIPFAYSRADIIVQARVKEEINVFAGMGKPQDIETAPDGTITYIGWIASPNLAQLYVPNIVTKRNVHYEWTSLGRQALQITNCTRIES